MSLTASAIGSFQLPSQNIHVARCVRVIDLGTQCDDYKGKTKQLHKVMIAWELPSETAVFDEARGEEPFLVSKKYTLALGEKPISVAILNRGGGKVLPNPSWRHSTSRNFSERRA